MRYANIVVLLALIVPVLFSTCQKQDGEDYSQEIDSLLTELRAMDDSLSSLNIREVQQINDSLSPFYNESQKIDTQDKRFYLYERSQDIMKWYGNLNREINYSRSHLKALKEDFESEELPDSTKEKKLKEERRIISSIRERFEKEYQSLRKEVDALLNRHRIDE